MKLFSLILATLCFSISLSAQTVLNGPVGIDTTPTGNARLEVQSPLPNNYGFRFKTSEPAFPDFTINQYAVPFANQTFNGQPRDTQVFELGYNARSAQNINEPKLDMRWEMFYLGYGSGNVDEWHLTYHRPGAPSEIRAFSWLFNRDNDYAKGAAHADQFMFSDRQGINEGWLSIFSSPTEGVMSLVRDSRIDFYGNTRPYFITYAGTGLMGISGNTFNLFQGGITGETVQFFKNSDLSAPLTVKIGSVGSGFRIGSSQRMQVSGNGVSYSNLQTADDVSESSTAGKIVQRDSGGAINTSAVKINGVTVLNGQCAAIPDPQPTERVNNVTTIAILNCLREIKLLAQ